MSFGQSWGISDALIYPAAVPQYAISDVASVPNVPLVTIAAALIAMVTGVPPLRQIF
ncbi:hypothetical protein FHT28_005161 [Rhizobium sp. SG570]|nr:hypothetical protein [Rhizobium sp. SG570]